MQSPGLYAATIDQPQMLYLDHTTTTAMLINIFDILPRSNVPTLIWTNNVPTVLWRAIFTCIKLNHQYISGLGGVLSYDFDDFMSCLIDYRTPGMIKKLDYYISLPHVHKFISLLNKYDLLSDKYDFETFSFSAIIGDDALITKYRLMAKPALKCCGPKLKYLQLPYMTPGEVERVNHDLRSNKNIFALVSSSSNMSRIDSNIYRRMKELTSLTSSSPDQTQKT